MSKLRNGASGFGLVGLLLAMLIIGVMSMQYFRAPGPGGGVGDIAPAQAIDRAWDAACQMNIMRITQQLQIAAMSKEPQVELDLPRLFAPNPPPVVPQGCPCRYRFDEKRNVVCTFHR